MKLEIETTDAWPAPAVKVILSGGARSGKSEFILELAKDFKKVIWIATADHQNADEELLLRIARHKKSRRILSHELFEIVDFKALEDPKLLKAIQALETDLVVIDNLTLLLAQELSNSMNLYTPSQLSTHLDSQITFLLRWMKHKPTAIVTSEVGLGVVPHASAGRLFRDALGEANRRLVSEAEVFIKMESGIPVVLKGQDLIKKHAAHNDDALHAATVLKNGGPIVKLLSGA
jgi:adenosylcobinamide kinase / adenosylcobinamide-phosphate guanylyltransferase